MRSKLSLFTFLFFTIYSFSQTVKVTGNVLDSNSGYPLVGVNVSAKDYKIGASTDFDGNFTISDVPIGVTLIFSYVGYITNEFKVVNSNPITINMLQDLKALDEVVVIGYGTKSKKDVTGSISIVDAKTIEDLRPIKAELALQGTVAGVFVNAPSGAPGSQINIRIRGISSNNENGPLVFN